MLSSHDDARGLLDQVRAAFGLGPAAPVQDEAFRAQLAEAHPLLSLMLARLAANDTAEERADLRHNWHKALRRRGWDLLPPLDGSGGGSRLPSVPPPASASRLDSVPAPATALPTALPTAPGPTAAATGAGDLEAQVVAFLALFGVALPAPGMPLAMWPSLPEVVARQRRLADQLLRAPLRTPEAYQQAYRAVVDPWNEVVGRSALRIPD